MKAPSIRYFLSRRSRHVPLLIAMSVVALSLVCRGGETPRASIGATPDLSDHPVYSAYEFGEAANIINIGVQPLYMPPGLIVAAMRRDAVLQEALDELGLEVRFFPFFKGYDVNFFLKRGQLDAGIVGDMPALVIAAEYDVTMVSLIQLGFTSIVANRAMLLTGLRGKSIAFAYGSNAYYSLMNALASEGITAEDVKLVSMDADEMGDALRRGQIDAFSAWEPFPTIAALLSRDATVIHRSQSSGYLYFSRAFLDAHPAAVRQLVAAEIRALRWLRASQRNLLLASRWALAEGQALTSGRGERPAQSSADLTPELTVKLVAELALQDIVGLESAFLIPPSFLEQGGPLAREFEFLKDLGAISGSVEWNEIRSDFDREITLEIVADQDAYRLNEFNYVEAGASE